MKAIIVTLKISELINIYKMLTIIVNYMSELSIRNLIS